jgi:uncharacterized cupredoxin-like copper-binding protein
MRTSRTLIAFLLLLGALALTACGSSDKKKSSSTSATASKPATLSVTAAESGKKAKLTAPASVSGGIVTVTLQNSGKAPHEAQLVRLDPGRSIADVMKIVNSPKIPTWAHLYGGVAATPPGKSDTATVSLTAGNYVIVDNAGGGGPGASGPPPAIRELKVTGGAGGSLPSTDTTVTAASPSKDKYKWDIQGTLKAGDNRLTFVSKGDPEAVHFIGAVRLKGNPSDAQIQKALKQNGKPPPFLDFSTFTSTSILDAGKSEVASLALRKPGEYLLFCPLTDKDGGKSHDQEGLVTRVQVK